MLQTTLKPKHMSERIHHDIELSSVDIIKSLYRIAPKIPNSSRLFFNDMFAVADEKSSVSIPVIDSNYVALFDVKVFDPEEQLEVRDDTEPLTATYLYRFRLFQEQANAIDKLVFVFEAYQNAEDGIIFVENFGVKNKWKISPKHLKEFFRMAFDDISELKNPAEIMLGIEKKREYALAVIYFAEYIQTLDYDQVKIEHEDKERAIAMPGKEWIVLHYSNH